jgi:Fe2+ or Zn2+ uptake regulation protein
LPISREEFDAGQIDLGIAISEFLTMRREDAFTATEILEQLIRFGRAATLAEVALTLESLVKLSRVESKEFSGSRWYTIINT